MTTDPVESARVIFTDWHFDSETSDHPLATAEDYANRLIERLADEGLTIVRAADHTERH